MRARVGVAAMARGQPQRRRHRQGQHAVTHSHHSHHSHQRVADAAEAPGLAIEPEELVEPVPVAPMELVLPGVDDEVSLEAVPVLEPVVLPMLAEPLVEPGVVLEPVVVEPVPLEPVAVPVPWRLHADRDRAAATEITATVAWVKVIFIGKLLLWGYAICAKRKGSRNCPDPTLGRSGPRRVGTGSNRV